MLPVLRPSSGVADRNELHAEGSGGRSRGEGSVLAAPLEACPHDHRRSDACSSGERFGIVAFIRLGLDMPAN